MSTERVTVREYDTADDAKAAEALLLESGLTTDIVSRSGKKLRVVSGWEDEARSLLAGTGSTVTDPLAPGAGDPVLDAAAMTTPADEVMPPADYYVENQGSSVGGAAASAADTARGVASSATQSAQSAASTVADTAQGAATTAADTVQSAASTVTETVQDVAAPVTDQISRVTQPVAEQMDTLAQTVRQKGATSETPGVVRVPAETTAGVLEKTSQYLRQPDLNVVIEDVRGAVRRNPVRSLLVGLGLGYLLRSTVFSGGEQQAASGGASGGDVSADTGASDASLAAMGAADTTTGYGAVPAYGFAEETDALAGTDAVPGSVTTPDLATTSDLPASYGDPIAAPTSDDVAVSSLDPTTTEPGEADAVLTTDEVMVFEADPVVVEDATDTTASGEDTTNRNTGV